MGISTMANGRMLVRRTQTTTRTTSAYGITTTRMMATTQRHQANAMYHNYNRIRYRKAAPASTQRHVIRRRRTPSCRTYCVAAPKLPPSASTGNTNNNNDTKSENTKSGNNASSITQSSSIPRGVLQLALG